jgi:hypothetical protein
LRTEILVLLAGLAACSSPAPADDAGPTCPNVIDAAASSAPIALAGGNETYTFGNFVWGRNNDCTIPGGPISITILGALTTPNDSSYALALCLPRPDLVTSTPLSLSDTGMVQQFNFGARDSNNACQYSPNLAISPTATVQFAGFCTVKGASFVMTLSGDVAAVKNCGGTKTDITMTLSGATTVNAQ